MFATLIKSLSPHDGINKLKQTLENSRSHFSNVQNKQQEQHLPVQQPQMTDKK